MNIHRYLPSKKIRIIILTLFVLLVGFLVYYFFDGASNPKSNLIDVVSVDDYRSSDYYLDSDNDGAYDWEEALFDELDPHNPDSDGDGVLDGKYLQNKRQIQERERRGGVLPESTLSESEKLGRSTLTALLAIVQSGSTIDGQTQEQFSDNISNYVNELTLGNQLYTRDQLQLVDDSRENSYRYRDAMTQLFKTYPVATSDIELVIQATDNPTDYQGQVRGASRKYNEYLSELVTLEVPYVIAGRHTELINNVSQLNAGFENLLADEIDELVSLSLLVQLENIMNSTVEAIVKINTYFDIISDPSVFN
ncbi:hypothetical protein KC866_01825 [Patescibacteria group bacterium]|nr:hypothetical protein [Patescibacteria group bacterium]